MGSQGMRPITWGEDRTLSQLGRTAGHMDCWASAVVLHMSSACSAGSPTPMESSAKGVSVPLPAKVASHGSFQQHNERGPCPLGLWLPVSRSTVTVAHAPQGSGVRTRTVTVAHAPRSLATRAHQHSHRGPRLFMHGHPCSAAQ